MITRHIACFLALLSMICSGCVSRLFYYPDSRIYQTPLKFGLNHEEVTFPGKDGTKLTGWFVPAKGKAEGTVIHFHGNAQNMTAHFSYAAWLPAEGFNVFTFDYRGYGNSKGTPGRQGVYDDCAAAMAYIRQRPDIDPEKLLILGQSLGGANAIALMGREHCAGVRAVAIDSTFYSYRSIVRDKIGQMPVIRFLKWPLSFLVIGNSHSPGPVVDNISPVPLLLIHGTADQVIPYHHGQDLLDKAKEPKQLLTVPGGDHTQALTVYGDAFRKEVLGFYRKALLDPEGRQ